MRPITLTITALLAAAPAQASTLIYDSGIWTNIVEGGSFYAGGFAVSNSVTDEVLPFMLPYDQISDGIEDTPVFPGNIFILDASTAPTHGADWLAINEAVADIGEHGFDSAWHFSVGLDCTGGATPTPSCGRSVMLPARTLTLDRVEMEFNRRDQFGDSDIAVIQFRVYADVVPEPSTAALLLFSLWLIGSHHRQSGFRRVHGPTVW
jgi:hypothetical protein